MQIAQILQIVGDTKNMLILKVGHVFVSLLFLYVSWYVNKWGNVTSFK